MKNGGGVMRKENEFKYKMVIAAREDLKLSPGKLAVQVAHAAVACALEARRGYNKWLREWMKEGAKKVVVKVEHLEDFYPLKDKAEELKIPYYMVEDAGLTEIPPGTKTVIGFGPAPANIIDQITGHLPLL